MLNDAKFMDQEKESRPLGCVSALPQARCIVSCEAAVTWKCLALSLPASRNESENRRIAAPGSTLRGDKEQVKLLAAARVTLHPSRVGHPPPQVNGCC